MKFFQRSATFVCLLTAFKAVAFVPDLGLVVRHQPTLLRGNPQPVVFDGSVEIEGERAHYQATWGGASTGSAVKFEKLPTSWVNDGVSSVWVVRNGSACALMINHAPFPCMNIRLWSDFELGASSERVIQNLTSSHLALSSDLGLRSIDSKDYVGGSARESKMVASFHTVQGVAVGTIDYAGPNGTLLAFDPTFYSLMFARLPVDSVTWELSASPEFHLEKEDSRNNWILSKRIEAREGPKLIGVDRRENARRVPRMEIPAGGGRGSASEIPLERFTEKGKNFLKLLFLTH